MAHEHSVPCFNDAAADVPPISNLWNYTQMGFDLVTFSGGKGNSRTAKCRPAAGRKDPDRGRRQNNNPFDGVARGHESS